MPHGVICLDCQRIVAEAHMGRCEECQAAWRARAPKGKPRRPARPRQLTAARMTNHSIYRTAKWREVRKARIQMDGGVCRVCGTSENLTVHHIVPITRDESLAYALENLATVCRRCHGRLDGGRAHGRTRRR